MNEHTSDCTSHGASYSAMTFYFLAGGLAGAAVALLLAPQSGTATRQLMRSKLDEAAESARTLKGRMVDTLTDAATSARDFKDQAVSRGRALREEATYRVEGAASALAGKNARKDRGNGDLEDGKPSA